MNLLTSRQITDHIKNIIHADTQLHTHRIDLTVDAIYQFTKAGSLDFGGSEFEPAESQIITPLKKSPEDDYGWWQLESGCYKAMFNEQIALGDQSFALMNPHEHAQNAGLVGNTSFFAENETVNFMFQVPLCGCNIKENARLATLFMFGSE